MWSFLWCAQCSRFCLCTVVIMGYFSFVLNSGQRMTLRETTQPCCEYCASSQGKMPRLFFASLKKHSKMGNYRVKIWWDKNNEKKAWLLRAQNRNFSSSREKWRKKIRQNLWFWKNNKFSMKSRITLTNYLKDTNYVLCKLVLEF